MRHLDTRGQVKSKVSLTAFNCARKDAASVPAFIAKLLNCV